MVRIHLPYTKPQGGQQSVIGLRMMEVIYPTAGRQTIFNNPKVKMALEKEVRKRGLTLDDLEAEEEAVDGDLDGVASLGSDLEIERCVKKVWEVYDVKRQNVLPRKVIEQFFQDTLQLYAIRRAVPGKKPDVKSIVAPKTDMKKAMVTAVSRMNTSNSGNITYQEFEQFVFAYSIEEALEPFLGGQGVDIDMNVQFVDVSQFNNATREGPKLVYRDYPDD